MQITKKSIFSILITISSVFCTITSSVTYARLTEYADAPYENLSITQQHTINKNGTGSTVVTTHAKILNDRGKAYWGHYTLGYNKDSERLTILEAKTMRNGKVYPVHAKLIEDKPVSSNVQSFDQIHRVTIAFPQLETGSEVYLKYKHESLIPQIENQFSSDFVFGLNSYTHNRHITIQSLIPLKIEINDQQKYLKVTDIKDGKKQIIDIQLTKPITMGITDEPMSLLNPKRIPWVTVSSYNSWQEAGLKLAKDYIQIQKQHLPKMYQEIAAIAQKESSTIEKINSVTSQLADKILYLSDQRTVKGKIIPQPLQKVVDTRLGDCKDFATATTVILKSMGIPAEVALVRRGQGTYETPTKLPTHGKFNHAIVKVTLPNKALWVDPTNHVSMANYTFPDILDRDALVLTENNAKLERIPLNTPEDAKIVRTETLHFQPNNKLNINGSLELRGIHAYPYTGAELLYSEATIRNDLVNQLNSYGQMLKNNVKMPNLKSRVVKDMVFDYNIETRNAELYTNAGSALPLSFRAVEALIPEEEQESDIFLGPLTTLEKRTILENIKSIGKHSLDCDIKSPWVDVSRKVKYNDNNVEIHQIMTYKQSWIDNEVLKTPEYKAFQTEIEKHFNNGVAIIFERNEATIGKA